MFFYFCLSKVWQSNQFLFSQVFHLWLYTFTYEMLFFIALTKAFWSASMVPIDARGPSSLPIIDLQFSNLLSSIASLLFCLSFCTFSANFCIQPAVSFPNTPNQTSLAFFPYQVLHSSYGIFHPIPDRALTGWIWPVCSTNMALLCSYITLP